MKKEIYNWSDGDYEETIYFDDEYKIFQVETSHSPNRNVDRKIIFIDLNGFEAMKKALKEARKCEKDK